MSYQINSLGYRKDFIFNRLDGSVEDKGNYIVATTASNPNYFWGNLLLYKRPPQRGDFEKWKAENPDTTITLEEYLKKAQNQVASKTSPQLADVLGVPFRKS